MPRRKKTAAPSPGPSVELPNPLERVAAALYGFDPLPGPAARDEMLGQVTSFVHSHGMGVPPAVLSKRFGVNVEAVERAINAIGVVIAGNAVADIMLSGISRRIDTISNQLTRVMGVVQAQQVQPAATQAMALLDTWVAESPGCVRVAPTAYINLRDRIAGATIRERNAIGEALVGGPPRQQDGQPPIMIIGFPSTGGLA